MAALPDRSRDARIAALGYDYASQPVQVRTDCNLCGGERFDAVTHRDRYGYPAKADGCLRCGLVFLNPVMTPEAYAGFYRAVYRPLVSAYHGRRIDAETIQNEQREYAAVRAALLAPHLERRSAKTLLDVGGSTGVVAHHLRERFDLAATVIDPAPLEIDVARRLGLRTLTGFVEDYDPGEERYDLITLCQTVDHLLDVSLSLRKIRSLMADGGLFYVDVVDFRAAYRRHGSVEEAIKIDHPFYLTEETTRAFLQRSGFEILAVDYAADHLHVGYVCAPATVEEDLLPDAGGVSRQWREIRSIQNRAPGAYAAQPERSAATTASCRVHFGGPGRPEGNLRDLLADRVARVPPGGTIDWVTYYFRDRRLAEDLAAAQRRGVAVRVTLDGRPRTAGANDAVVGILREGLGDRLRVVAAPTDALLLGKLLCPRLHEKLYCFSHPEPTAWVGSFNPSADQPELAPEVVREIGDHDRAFNVLVELRREKLVDALVAHARVLHDAPHGPFDRFRTEANRSLEIGAFALHFWPRFRPDPVNRWLAHLPAGSRVRLAASHVSGPTAWRSLARMARQGVALEILADATHRRVPPAMVRHLVEAGAVVLRMGADESWTPMHDKFALVETPTERCTVFGSLNWSEPSRRFNREIGIVSGDPDLFEAFAGRWEELVEHASGSARGTE